MKIRRIAIFMPRDTAWYRILLRQLARGFSQSGLQVSCHCGLLDEAGLSAWVEQYRPDVVLEMNRSRKDVPFLSKEIAHICWLVDFNGRAISDFYGSDITYLFSANWLDKFGYDGLYRWLAPGSCVDDYYPYPTDFQYSAAFVGHIPKPWSEDELAVDISADSRPLRFGEVLPLLEPLVVARRNYLNVHDDYLHLLKTVVNTQFNRDVRLTHKLEYDISGRLIRMLNRRELIDNILAVTDVALFGPRNWAEWDCYRSYYRCQLDSVEQLRQVYVGAQINFHEGESAHFRVMDCMASGGLMLIKKNHWDDLVGGGIANFFTAGRHYVEFHADEVGDLCRYYLSNPTSAQRVRDAAASAVRRAHTWRHRAEAILSDLTSLGYKLAG